MFSQPPTRCNWSDGWGVNVPMGVSSRKVLALRLAPWDTNSSATCIWNDHVISQWWEMLQKPFACVHIRFLLPYKFTSPDPSTLQREAAAIHLNLSGPCEPPPPAAALQPGHIRWLRRCGAAGTNNLHLSGARRLLKIMFSALNTLDFTWKSRFRIKSLKI